MQVEPANRVSRMRDNKTSTTKRNTPATVKKVVSAASIFKRPTGTTNRTKLTPYENGRQDKAVLEDASATELGPSWRRPHKIEKRVVKKRSDIHPITAAFKDTSEDYRRHLYTTASHTINRTLVTLLRKLHESTLQLASTHDSPHDLQASQLQLTAPVKYERMAAKLYQPLSQYRLSLYSTNAQGERQRVEATLALRMQDYKDHLARQTEDVARLQNQWETIVGEIWKLGVSCLGQDTMEQLSLAQDGGQLTTGFPSDMTKADSTLFVPEHASSTPLRATGRGKKHVTFQVSATPSQTTEYRAFLDQPSRYPKDSLPMAPLLPTQEARKLTKEIKELGKLQVEELRKIEKEKQEFWKRKTKLIMQSLAEE